MPHTDDFDGKGIAIIEMSEQFGGGNLQKHYGIKSNTSASGFLKVIMPAKPANLGKKDEANKKDTAGLQAGLINNSNAQSNLIVAGQKAEFSKTSNNFGKSIAGAVDFLNTAASPTPISKIMPAAMSQSANHQGRSADRVSAVLRGAPSQHPLIKQVVK